MLTNATIQQLETALKMLNVRYNDNLEFKNISQVSRNRVRFTLRVKDSNGKGARQSWQGRKTVSACWHVHGELFDLLMIVIDQSIKVQSLNKSWMYYDADQEKVVGNWEDIMIGSQMQPVYMSCCCECDY